MPTKKREQLQWFARCQGIKRMGPFESQLKATQSIRRIDDGGAEFPPNAFVWPEKKEKRK